MGRSVSTPSGATIVAYAVSEETCEDNFDWMIEDYQDQLRAMFPSVTTIDKWIGREDHVVAENRHATFGISEYCGLVAYWAIPQTDLGLAWLNQIEPKFAKAFGTLAHAGTASNGEAFFQRKA